MGSRILWAIVGGFLLGVFVRSFIALSWPFSAFAFLLGCTCAAYILLDREKAMTLAICAAACISFGLGIMRMDVSTQTGDAHLTSVIGKKVTIEGMVSGEPDVRENGVRLPIQVATLAVGSTTIPVNAGVLVLAPLYTDVSYGDVIRATGTLQLPEAFDTGAGRAFDYPEYLAKDGLLYELSFARTTKTGENRGNPLTAAAIAVKHIYLSGLEAVLSEPESGLAGGITVGDKRSIGSELSAQFQKVSLIHMVVLSGYNITVVINAIARMLAWAPRTLRFSMSGFGVFFFILMAGGAASAVRAGIMAMLAMYARISGRVFIAMRILGVTAVGMVLWNPFTLAFDPSFQLSALATLGLISFTPVFSKRMPWVSEKFGLREILASTLGTQLAVLPLLLYENGNLSIVALPANLLALIPVPLAMFWSFVAALGGILFGSYAVVLAFPAYIVLAYIIGVAQLFAAFPFASVSVAAFSAWWMFFAYAVLFGGLWLIPKKEDDRS
jgi:competence protein ComEC